MGRGFRFGDCLDTLEKPRTSFVPQSGAYIHRVEPSHLTWRAVFRILTETEPMTVTNTMISALLIAQLRRFHLLALAGLWGVASCAPWGNGVKKPA